VSRRDANGKTRRGTVHANERGSSRDRRRRREWIMQIYGVMDIVTCALCAVPLLADEFVVGRIVPGCRGGKYTRDNVRPECPVCSSEIGGGQRRVVATVEG
jgi:hypothetical protein